ncbi:hypothetical protein BLL52_3040 [Rhodoferax antarcticus ANT.BR]|uniref:Uncharacterized protein n=1 Tax=Rhodoferax antarcticus ANT.BR TaxID=1111071 RepID=A0A1Q8YCC0_9BURK|nr:hypothetical protein BLL52_3040 [Rhodoferax antarcticus ANT.BR]
MLLFKKTPAVSAFFMGRELATPGRVLRCATLPTPICDSHERIAVNVHWVSCQSFWQ